MYEKIKIFLIFVFATIFQISFLPNLFFGRIAPDFVLLLVIILSFRKKFDEFWFWIIIAGFILDFISLGVVGVSSLIFLFISFGVNFFANRFFISRKNLDFFAITFFIFCGTVINYLGFDFINSLVVYFAEQDKLNFVRNFDMQILGIKIINNLLFLFIVYWPITQLSDIFSVEKNKLIVK
jgi:rod shape-determining protein MreD